MSRDRKKIILLVSALLGVFGVSLLFPQTRLYLAAWAGSSDAMVRISDEYYKIPYGRVYSGLFHPDREKGDYWMRRSAEKGNRTALKRIIMRWGISNAYEVVFWLKHGCDLGIPWCAEELAGAYYSGRFALAQDFGKAREYDDLAVQLHRKDGTLKEHGCLFLSGTSLGVSATSPYSPFTQREIHPGIPRESVTRE